MTISRSRTEPPDGGATRPRRAVPRTYRRLMRFLLCSLLLTSILADVLPAVPMIQFGSSQLRAADLFLLAFVGLWTIQGVVGGRMSVVRSHTLIYGLLVVLIVPVFTGLLAGKSVLTVLRDVRTPVFFLAILPIVRLLRSEREVDWLVRFMTAVSAGTLLYGYIAWSRHVPSGEDVPYRFGIGSALNLNVWVMFLCLGRLAFNGAPGRARRLAWLYAAATLVFVFFGNDIRSVYVGVMGGLAVFSALLGIFGPLRLRLAIVASAVAVLLVAVLGSGLAVVLQASGVDLRDLALRDMRLRRLYSLIDPTIAGTVDVSGSTNRDDRVLGFVYGYALGRRHGGLGLGYGDNPFVDLPQETIDNLTLRDRLEGHPGNAVENLLLYHNSYGWALGRLGLWAATGYFLLVLLMAARALGAMSRTRSPALRSVLAGSLAFTTYMLLFGFGGGGFFDYTGQALVTWLVCLAVLTRAAALARTVRSGASTDRVVAPSRVSR